MHWQDSHLEIVKEGTLLTDLGRPYVNDAKEMTAQFGFLFRTEPRDPGDAMLVEHPPGYSILWAALYGGHASIHSAVLLRSIQLVLDGAACVIVVLIAAELFAPGIALVAGSLAALSPHLAYYSLWFSPDSLAALPVLAAVYLIIRAKKRPRVVMTILAGAFIGLSCWLRANAIFLALFLAACFILWFKQRNPLRHAIAIVGGMALAIAPITIRNLVVFHRFIPVSIHEGVALIEGIGDYDKEGRFGLPDSDAGVADKDVEWSGRPDYGSSLWRPDGIERDRIRFARGLAVVRSNPGWFLETMIRRIGFMLRYNDNSAHDWLSASATVAPVSAHASFGHPIALTGAEPTAWADAVDLVDGGTRTDPRAQISPEDGGRTLSINARDSEYSEQSMSRPMPVSRNTDYLMQIPVTLISGDARVAIMTGDRRDDLASTIVGVEQAGARRRAMKKARAEGLPEPAYDAPITTMIDLPFASGNHTDVRLVFSNRSQDAVRPVTQAGAARLFELGPTPYQWTRYPRAVIRVLQKNLFVTWRMILLILAGIVILAVSRRYEAIGVVLSVPIYYMVTQSTLHTEYRYILPIHYFLFIFSGVSVYCGCRAFELALKSIRTAIPARR